MDSFEWNKIIGAVLGTLIFIFVIRLVAENVYEQEKPAKPGYIVEGVVETPAGGTAAAPVEEAMPDWGTVLPVADVAAGKATSAKCEQCHDTSSAKTNKIGPALYGVVGRARATVPGFEYSGAMKAKGGSWTYDELFKFIKSPQLYISGTKMTFPGLSRAQDRINLIAFLRTNTDGTPVAIPPPAPKAAAPATAAKTDTGADKAVTPPAGTAPAAAKPAPATSPAKADAKSTAAPAKEEAKPANNVAPGKIP